MCLLGMSELSHGSILESGHPSVVLGDWRPSSDTVFTMEEPVACLVLVEKTVFFLINVRYCEMLPYARCLVELFVSCLWGD